MEQGTLQQKLNSGILSHFLNNSRAAGTSKLDASVHLMTKVPFPGKVKTRLIPELGIAGATEAYWQMLEWILPRIYEPKTWRLKVWLTHLDSLKIGPFGQDIEKRMLALFEPFSMAYGEQSNGNLGQRLNEVFRVSKYRSAQKSIIVGGDSVSVDQTLIELALKSLETSDVVISPTDDGGFCLLGAKRPIRGLDKYVNWGSDSACADLTALCKGEGLRMHQLDQGFDVDTHLDWLTFLKYVEQP